MSDRQTRSEHEMGMVVCGRFLGSGSPSRPPPTVSEPQASGWVGRTTERNEEPQEWIIKGRWSHHNVFHSFPLSFFVGMRPPSLSSGVPWRSPLHHYQWTQWTGDRPQWSESRNEGRSLTWGSLGSGSCPHRSPSRPHALGVMMGGYEDSFGLHAPSTHHSFRSPRASFIHSEWP